jgi:hypothetical protein
MKNSKRALSLKVVILIALVLGAIYLISTYTRRHETKIENTPKLTETQRGGDGTLK